MVSLLDKESAGRVRGGSFQKKSPLPFDLEVEFLEKTVKAERIVLAVLGIATPLLLGVPILYKDKLDKSLIAASYGLGALTSGLFGAIALSCADRHDKYYPKVKQTHTAIADLTLKQRGKLALEDQILEAKVERCYELMRLYPPQILPIMAKEAGVLDVMMSLIKREQPAIDVPVQYPDAIPVQVLPTQSQPNKARPTSLPDGAQMITVEDLAKNDLFPVVMVIAGQGKGKTVTMNWILRRLPGVRVFVSADAKKSDFAEYEKVFGAYGDYGNPKTVSKTDDKDMSVTGRTGSICEFLWAVPQEIKNRQQLEKSEIAAMCQYRCFFDEAADTYTSFSKEGQELQEDFWKATFFNARKHGIQIFTGAQSESVELIGMKNLSKARDDLWHLFPGDSAIACAEANKRPFLASYLREKLNRGEGVALLEKSGIEFRVLDLPSIEELKNDRAPVNPDVPEVDRPTKTQPAPTAPGGEFWLDRLEAELKKLPNPTAEQAIVLHEKLFGQALNDEAKRYLLTTLRDRQWPI